MRVLVAIEDSDRGMQALEAAVDRAREAGDELTVAVYTSTDESLTETKTAVEDRLETLEFDAEIVQIEEGPGSKLVELAEREGHDQIVLSGGQRSPLGKIKLDSVHEFVLLNAHTTVTLVR